jgi:hypothetical protein
MRGAAFVVLLVFACAAARAEGADIVAHSDIPAAVMAAVQCDDTGQDMLREPFAGGVLFRWQCPGSSANLIQALVFADDNDGRGARLLKFPRPGHHKRGTGPSTELSNVRLILQSREIAEIFVVPEGGGYCRFEGRWRLSGEARKPVLVSYRQTRDCEGRRGWIKLFPRP